MVDRRGWQPVLDIAPVRCAIALGAGNDIAWDAIAWTNRRLGSDGW